MMFLSSIFFISVLSMNALSENLWDSIISVFAAFLFNILLSFPIFMLKSKGKNTAAILSESKKFKFILVFYALYFILSDILVLLQIQTMFLNTIYPDNSALILIVLVLSVSFYGAFKGTESVGRSSLVVFITVIICLSLVFLGIVDFFDLSNREQFFYTENNDSVTNFISIFSRASILPQLCILSFSVNGNMNFSSYSLFQLLGGFLCAFSFFMIVLTMGRFAETQLYPLYSLFSFSSIPPFERIDVLFSIIWLMTLCVKISTDLLCIKSLFIRPTMIKHQNKSAFISAIIIGTISIFAINFNLMTHFSSIQYFVCVSSLFLGVLIPLILLANKKNKKGT